MVRITTPIRKNVIENVKPGDMLYLSGVIYTGRDAVLPMVASLINDGRSSEIGVDLEGSVIFHTAVSPAGVGPTSSNKEEIEENIPILSEAGVKIHLGKGRLKAETIKALDENDSIYAVIPPVTALLEEKTITREVAAFSELGMEAFHRLEVVDFPIIIAAAHGKSIY